MSYIRGALPFLIYNPNTRDDLLPDGVKQSFELSQEVPGGYESNVQVVKREFKLESIVQSSPLINFERNVLPSSDIEYKITCQNAPLAAALSVISPGDIILVSGASNAQNNTTKGHIVLSSLYNGSTISFTVEPQTALVNEAAGALVSIDRRFVGPWEVLEPEVDYRISKNADGLHKIISFTVAPQEKDSIYVTHRGEATYNFVPTEKSVGPAQLSENLRAFKLDIFTGDGVKTDFELTIDEPDEIVNARTLEVSIDGVLKYGTDGGLGFTGDFELLADKKTIRFASAPASGAKIHVRNLGFSTVARRQSLSPSQTGSIPSNSVGTQQLQNGAVTESKMAELAVSSSIIQSDAVNGSKILLKNDEWLRAESGTTPGAKVSILKIDSSNRAVLRSAGGPLSLNVSDTRVIQVSTSSISDATSTGQVDLGTLSNKFRDAYLSGNLQATNASLGGALSVTGQSTFNDVTVNGSITITGSIDNVDISDLRDQVAALAALVAENTPAGSIKLWAKDTSAPTGYLLCDGAQYSKVTYANLYAAIGDFFNAHQVLGAPSSGNFRVPDFRGRFPLGKAGSGTGSGWGSSLGRGGELDHQHDTPDHQHGLANHTHPIPPHYHSIKGKNQNNTVTDFGSTLEIGLSGVHNTSLTHTHDDKKTESETHSHSTGNISTGDQDADHTHDVIDITTFRPWTNTSSSQPGRDWGTGYNIYYRPSDSDPNRATTKQSANHKHGFSVSFTNDGGHTHTLKALSFTGSTSGTEDGKHSHTNSSFSGSIGNVASGSNGDGVFNTVTNTWESRLSTSASSTTKTDPGGGSLKTGNANPAFQTINFIIKT